MRKSIALFIALIMIMCSVVTLFQSTVYAMNINDEPGGLVDDVPGGDLEPGGEGLVFTVNFGTASWNVNGVNVTAASSDFQDLTEGAVQINEKTNIKLGNFNPDTMRIKVTAEDGFNTELSVNPEKNGNDYETKLENRPDGVNFPAEATLTFSVESNGVQVDDITINAHFTNTHMLAFINNTQFMDDADGNLKDSFEGVVPAAGTANPDGTNTFKFQSCFGDLPVAEYTINGTVYKAGDEGVVVGEDGLYTITVPGAATYTITGVADDNGAVPRTIIWVNPDYVPADEDDAAWVKDFTVEHGYAKVVEVYGANDQLLDPKDYTGEGSDEYGLNKGFGWVSVFPGTRVVFEFVPEYGYQLTGIAINEQPLAAVEATNRFEINIPEGGGNVHFAATFTKTEDVVKADSENVTGGTIELPENTIDAGTVQLKVTDVVLEDAKIKGFEGAAQGAELKHFLDIDLYQVFYKGKKDDTDVWANQIEELDGEAEITLHLSEDVDVENVVIVHNIHNGDEYEVIEIIRYDKEAHTITFRTKSFSNYAIATKTKSSPVNIILKDATTGVVISFYDEDGHTAEDFEFVAADITNLTDEQIEALGIPKTEYTKGLEKIKEASKTYGGLIMLYNLQVSLVKEKRDVTDGPFTIRIPCTDALKDYESIKIAYVDSEDFSLKELVELKLEDGYYVGELAHLSPYALVGKAVTKTDDNTNNGNNPSTGDNIVIFGSIFVLSILAMGFEVILIKKSKNYR